MIKYLRNVLIFTLGLAVFPAVHAATPPIAQAEINYLLEFVESSGCEFYRNGTWYDSRKARTHLQSKYEILFWRYRSAIRHHPCQYRHECGPYW